MKLLITGGCGFMGSHAVRYFLHTYPDCEIINLDKLTYSGNPENLRDIEQNPHYHFIRGDIVDSIMVADVMGRGIDVVLNYAAETHVDRSILDPRAFVVTDVIGTYTLLEAARAVGIKKFIQISTDEVYGSIVEGVFTENSCLEPNSPYAASKAGADLLCRSYVKTYQMPVIVTHSCNFYGANQYPEKVIPLFITNLLEGKKVPLYGDGRNVREWIYVTDHCHAIDIILQKGIDGEIYNIGTGDEIANIDLTRKVLERCGASEDMIEPVADRAGHDRRYALDSSKLRALGWQAQQSFDGGLTATVQWYKDHGDWWQPLKSGERYQSYYKRQYK